MLLEIDRGVFADDIPDSMTVIRLVGYTVEERHTWLPSPEIALVALEFLEEHVPKQVSWREYVTNAAAASAWQQAEATVPVQVTADNVATLAEELGWPAVIVVENARNDGSFLRAVFAAYDPRVAEAVRRHWLEIDHGGGTGDQRYVAIEAAKRFRHVCRVMVLKDNDKRLPQPTGHDLTDWSMSEPMEHVWRRHEVENYLPDAVLERSTHPVAGQLLRYLRTLPPEQQGWIDMKKGLQKGPDCVREALPAEAHTVWERGYGDHLPKPLVPEELTLTVDDFRALGDDVHAELRHLLQKILRLL